MTLNPIMISNPLAFSTTVDYTTRECIVEVHCVADELGCFMHIGDDIFVPRKSLSSIKRVMVNGPATIMWDYYGKKTVVKATNETLNLRKGLIMCLLKHTLSSKQYNDICSAYKNKKAANRETEAAYAVLSYIYGKKKLNSWLADLVKEWTPNKAEL